MHEPCHGSAAALIVWRLRISSSIEPRLCQSLRLLFLEAPLWLRPRKTYKNNQTYSLGFRKFWEGLQAFGKIFFGQLLETVPGRSYRQGGFMLLDCIGKELGTRERMGAPKMDLTSCEVVCHGVMGPG